MKTTTKKKPRVEALVKRLILLQKKVEQVKPIYEEIDEITLSIAQARQDGDVVFETKNSDYVLKDNFAARNTAYRVAAIKRFEIIEKKKAS